jgi:hypothetical protein
MQKAHGSCAFAEWLGRGCRLAGGEGFDDDGASGRAGVVLRAVRSVFSDEKKLSIAALSQTMPERLYLQQYILFLAAPASA